MMRKVVILASATILATSLIGYAGTEKTVATTQKEGNQIERQIPPNFQRLPKGPEFKKRNAEFEKRLKLTEEQKTKAEEIRKNGFEQMKPIMEKMKEKHLEAQKLRAEQNTQNQEKLMQLHKEIGALKKEAHEIRMKNMKEFESILTKKQQKELKKLKEEGRKKFEREHKKQHPGFRPGFVPGQAEIPPQPPVQKEAK